MAWTYTTKAKVTALAQVPTTILQDDWSLWVEDLIDEYMGRSFTGTATYTENKDGDGTNIIFVDNPPIVSVTSLSVSDANFSASDYEVYESYVKLVTNQLTEVSDALYSPIEFPVGENNVEIVYVGGTATVPPKVELAATQMIAQIALVYKREGSDASLKYSRVTSNDGDNPTTITQYGLQSTLMHIMKKYLPRGWKMA